VLATRNRCLSHLAALCDSFKIVRAEIPVANQVCALSRRSRAKSADDFVQRFVSTSPINDLRAKIFATR
jgi:hypothetical protein